MKILAAYYTHNKIRSSLLDLSLKLYREACADPRICPIVSSWESIDGPILNILSPVKNLGLLNILLQIGGIVNACTEDWDYIAFCEHDCLYPPDYFTNVIKVLEENSNPPGLASLNHIGLRQNGYSKTKLDVHPMSMIVLRRDKVKDYLYAKFMTCSEKGWCNMEPDDRSGWVLQDGECGYNPTVHVNMDHLEDCHHITDHYNCYQLTAFSKTITWLGDYCRLGIFTEGEISNHTSKTIKYSDKEIIEARYGDGNQTQDFMDVLRKVVAGKRGVACNLELGVDPAPNKRKQLKITYRLDNKHLSHVFLENEVIKLEELTDE